MNESSPNQNTFANLSNITTYQAGVMQATMHRKLQKFCDNVLTPYDITKNHWLIIGTVYDKRATGIRISDLARAIGTNLPYMTNTVNILEEKKILARVENQSDSRSTFITVATKFMPKCRKIEALLRSALQEKVYDGISSEEFRIYMKVMYKLTED